MIYNQLKNTYMMKTKRRIKKQDNNFIRIWNATTNERSYLAVIK